MTDAPMCYEWHSTDKRTRNLISLGCGMASIWAAFHVTTITLAVIAAVFALGCIAAQVEQQMTIDTKSKRVSCKKTLWGRCLWSSEWSLDDFSGIGSYRLRGDSKSGLDLVHVGLRRSTGSILAIRYFSIARHQPCPEADAFAHSLEETLHLKIT